ncbi:MAG: DUF1648 domain-containing protein [Gemmatimonadetes bacterium]|nr:DUF1648 domain-containing protein [Gemmatimonadota bacterium]
MKTVHWINLLLLAGVIAVAALTWRMLPDRIPVHFGIDGQPTRWSGPSVLAWFGLPIITVLLVAFIYWMAGRLPERPHLVNMPRKDSFLALPPSRRAPVMERIQEFMYWATVPTIAVMGAVQWSMYRSALAGSTGIEILLILGVCWLIGPGLMILWSRHVTPELDRQIRENQTAG